jgi:hypothetical protein
MRAGARLGLCVILMAVVTFACGRRKEVAENKATWIRLSHQPVEEARAGLPTRIQAEVKVSGDVSRVELFIHCRTESSSCAPIKMTQLESGTYFGSVPAMGRGTLVRYYIQARAGNDLEVRVPAGNDTFSFFYKGTPNRPVLVARISLMFLALFIFIMCGYLAVKAIRDRKSRLQIPRLGFLAAVVFFISSIPLGMIVAYQTYGAPWGGFPIGNDFTDNKSLAILLYFAAATFLYRGSVFRRDPSRDLIKQVSTLPYVYLVGTVLAVVLFIIPR